MQVSDVAAVLRERFPDGGYDGGEEHVYWSDLAWVLRKDGETIDGVTYRVVEDFGGEGLGDTRYIVIAVEDGNSVQYFRKDGYYASYDGSTWDGDFREVKAEQKTITVYESTVEDDPWGGPDVAYDSFDDGLDSFS